MCTLRSTELAVAIAMLGAVGVGRATAENLALNPTRSGYPNPLASDRGWGGGSDKWQILDGQRSVDGVWAHGLAFTGGRQNYVEPAGPRQVTIDFGQPCEFSQVVIWHHGNDHVPAQTALDYWNGGAWMPINFARAVKADPLTGWSQPDTYDFDPVTGSRLRYRFDNRLANILGTQIEHGWIYEFEVMDVPEPATLSLLSLGALLLKRRRR